jgi:hypothetical protein
MIRKISGKLVQSGFVVVEEYTGQVHIPRELWADFQKNPEKYLRKFLQENGQKVNSVRLVRPAKGKPSGVVTRKRKGPHWYHVVYPENERSQWIYVGDAP